MKIENLSNLWVSSVEQAKAQAPQISTKRGEQNGTPTSFPEDSVDVSHPGVEDIRTEKVSALQHAISSGSYRVDTNDIADAMLRDWRG